MPDRPKYSERRENRIVTSLDRLIRKVTSFQRSLVSSILDYFLGAFDLDDDKTIKVTPSNFNAVNALQQLYDSWNEPRQADILKLVIDQLTDLHSDNRMYFENIVETGLTDDSAKVFNLMMKRLGYDPKNRVSTKGGYLQSIFDSDDPVIQLKVAALRAIVTKRSLADFKKDLEILMRGRDDTPGILEKHYGTHLYDVFQQYDREVGRLLAERLGLKYAIYQGGLIKTSRPFCIERNDKVFTVDEISLFGSSKDKYEGYEDKASGYFRGKTLIYNPFVDLGGYNCRHQLDYISNELGKLLKDRETASQAPADQKPNQYGHIQKPLNEFENEIYKLKHERGGFYNRDGVLQDIADGSKSQISLSHLDNIDTYNGIFTHNHPSWTKDPSTEGNSFSINDIITSLNFGFGEIRAVTGGSVYRMIYEDTFSIGGATFEKGKIAESTLPLIFRRIKLIEREVTKDLREELRNRLTGIGDQDDRMLNEISYRLWHEVWSRFVTNTKGIRYVKEKRSSE